jgi:50S ribosomal subunit-associated GTPase HflX
VRLRVPYQRGDVISFLHEAATVDNQEHTEDGVVLTVQLSPALYQRYKEYKV